MSASYFLNTASILSLSGSLLTLWIAIYVARKDRYPTRYVIGLFSAAAFGMGGAAWAAAQDSLFQEYLVGRPCGSSADTVRAGIERLLRARHGSEDFTVTTQQQMLDVLGSVLEVLTFAVAALGGISLFVGGVGILTIMTIAVRERRSEIGLLRAIGARRSQVLGLFLLESLLLSAAGGLAGLVIGLGLAVTIKILVPSLPVHPSMEYAFLAELLAMAIGLAAGVLPARHAARLQPLDALRAE